MKEQSIHNWSLSLDDTNVLKGIAIIAMLLHHVYGCPREGFGPIDPVLAFLGALGKVCVAIFLFCSGYGLSVKYGQIMDANQKTIKGRIVDTLRFLGKRFVKFYANYWIIFFIFVPISIFIFHRPLAAAYGEDSCMWGNLILDVFGLNGFNSYNITWWFNKLIIILYLLFPLLFFLTKRLKWGMFLLSIILARAVSYLPEWMDTVSLMTYQMPFVFGVCWQQNENKLAKVRLWLNQHMVITSVSAFVLLGIMIFLRMFPIIPHWFGIRMDTFVAVALALCIIIVPKIYWVKKTFIFLGKHAMNVYMFHTFFWAYWFTSALKCCEVAWGGGIRSSSYNLYDSKHINRMDKE